VDHIRAKRVFVGIWFVLAGTMFVTAVEHGVWVLAVPAFLFLVAATFALVRSRP
jgi:uncharacterized membrane protein